MQNWQIKLVGGGGLEEKFSIIISEREEKKFIFVLRPSVIIISRDIICLKRLFLLITCF